MDDRQWQATLNVLRSSRSPKHRAELEAMLREDRQKRQQELEQAQAQANALYAALDALAEAISNYNLDDTPLPQRQREIKAAWGLAQEQLDTLRSAKTEVATPDAQEASRVGGD